MISEVGKTKAQKYAKEKIDQFNYTKIKNFCSSKDIFKTVENLVTNWRKYFQFVMELPKISIQTV